MTRLFISHDLMVRAVPTDDASRWIITFDSYGTGDGFDRPGFGEAFLKEAGVSAIHVMGRREECYQYPEMFEAMEAVRKVVAGADRVMTYGSSMGGYAALRFADAVGANAVLAISPPYTADPKRVLFEKRWLQDAHRVVWLPEIDGQPIRCAARPLIIHDAIGEDAEHARLIGEEVEADFVRLPYVGHPATTYLGEVGLLAPIVFAMLDGTMDQALLRSEMHRRRRDSVTHLSRLADLQPAWRPRAAMALATRAYEVNPGSVLALAALARRLSEAGEHDRAIGLYSHAAAIGDRHVVHLVPYAIALMAAGRAAEAAPLTREATGRLPRAAHIWSLHAHALAQSGAQDEAVKAMEEAIRLHPTEVYYRDSLIRIRGDAA